MRPGIISITKKLFPAILALAALTGCKDETWHQDAPEQAPGIGTLSLRNAEFVLVSSKTTDDASMPLIDDFLVEVLQQGKVVLSFASLKSTPAVIDIPTGNYVLRTRSGDVKTAAWFEPYYESNNDIVISAGDTTHIDRLESRLANIKVTVSFDDYLRTLVSSDTHVDVAYQNEGDIDNMLTYTLQAIDYGHEGYFAYAAGGETLVATLDGEIDGERAQMQMPFVNLKPGQHQMVKFSVKPPVENPEDPNDPDNPDNPDDPNNPDTPDDPNNPDNPDDPNNPDNPDDPDDPNNPDNPDDPNNPDNPDDPKEPEGPDYTIGSFTLTNGLTINVEVTIVDLTYTLAGEEDPALGGILRPGDPGYTGNETPKPGESHYPWADDPDNPDNPDDPDDPNDPENPDDPNVPPVIIPDEPVIDFPVVDTPVIFFSSTSLDLEGPNDARNYGTADDPKPAELLIQSSLGIKNLFVVIKSPMLDDDMLSQLGLGTHFDLVNPGSMEQGLNNLGLPTGDQVYNQTEVTFSITNFVPLLQLLHPFDVAVYDNDFEITVVDMYDNRASLTLKIQTFNN